MTLTHRAEAAISEATNTHHEEWQRSALQDLTAEFPTFERGVVIGPPRLWLAPTSPASNLYSRSPVDYARRTAGMRAAWQRG